MNLNPIPAANARYLKIFSFSSKEVPEILLAGVLLWLVVKAVAFLHIVVGVWNALVFVWVGLVVLVGVPILILLLFSRFGWK